MLDSLSRVLRLRGFSTECFSSGDALLRRMPLHGAGCILLDLLMPGMSGIELQNTLRSQGDRTPIVFLTAHGDIRTTVTAMQHGAIDFLTKPVEVPELLAALGSAIERSRQHWRARRVLSRLSPRETEVMHLVIQGLTNKQVAAALGISEKTVKAHRGQVMSKLEAGSLAELVRFAASLDLEPPQNPSSRNQPNEP